ncbi:DUF6488 family protein [Magnetovibrio sp. PR-2]|uniref:DUF6488 family protein n=1 Tax=Magnetovibrio sp. PR-2 TaxID=3120356 RepID=UPI002FCDF338
MKWIQSVIMALFLAFGAQSAMAGAGHYHGPMSEAQAGQLAERVVSNMAQRGNLSTSWGGTSLDSLGKTTLDGNMVWRAVFSNAEEAAPEKRKLNVYLTLTGGFIKADYAPQ